ncbi:NUDIX hydrolase [Algivirga pacifica]|uniref:Nudix hydrolase domain-containing protein n=1 Tax=Algivirga pacifica TaxID=1162670 RepID=A0ABP9D1D1_9BACT
MKHRVCGLLIKDEHALLIEYRYPSEDPLWHIPGGGIEENESAEETLIREFEEELGIEIEVSSECLLTALSHRKNDGKPVKHSVYLVHQLDGCAPQIQPEHSSGYACRWEPVSLLAGRRLYPNLENYIEQLCKGKEFGDIGEVEPA